jgi:hypothetical protein
MASETPIERTARQTDPGLTAALPSVHRGLCSRPIVHGIAPTVASAPIYAPRALIVKSPQSLPLEREGMKLISKIRG